jgi:flagellar motor protein MotB
MTSLMVIFILLLLVFLKRSAGVEPAITARLLNTLKSELSLSEFGKENIQLDPKQPFTILVIVPDNKLSFDLNRSELRPEGERFLEAGMQPLAHILCSSEFRPHVDSIVVEGHTDAHQYRGVSQETSEGLNLALSQDRSMSVVKKSLELLVGNSDRPCFLERLSANGRGQQDATGNPDQDRRVVFKIRVKANTAELIGRRIAVGVQ